MRFLACVIFVACSSPAAAIDSSVISIDGAPDASACGVRTGMRSLSQRMVRVANLDRRYLVYLPQVDPKTPVPLVYVHHGYTMSGQDMYDITGYAALADREKIAVAFPDGQTGAGVGPWNVGMNVCPSYFGAPPNGPGDDFAFLDAMKADIRQDQCLDNDHVYMTGFSMGGYFSHQTGCLRDDIRAVAPHSGGTHDLAQCTTGKKPIIMFHGRSDALIPAGCNDPATPYMNITPAATAWAQRNGCGTTTTTINVLGGSCERYNNCPAGGQVEICTFAGMGHCWAGGVAWEGFGCPSYESATELAWDFFKTYAW